jgi:SWI/SNF-related matrix-associated actin-dependent regulator of chromatin subfamily A member 5
VRLSLTPKRVPCHVAATATFGLFQESRGISGPHIVVTPKSTVSNWMREFKRWCPSLRVLKLLGAKDERAKVVKDHIMPVVHDPTGTRTWDVVITS